MNPRGAPEWLADLAPHEIGWTPVESENKYK